MNTACERYSDVHNQCIELKQAGKWSEQIPLLEELIKLAEPFGKKRVSRAWARLAHTYHQTRQYELAEDASNKALANHDSSEENSAEQLATLQFQLARILAAQERFDEAVKIGESAIANFSVFHDPPTEFLRARISEVAEMRKSRHRATPTGDNKPE